MFYIKCVCVTVDVSDDPDIQRLVDYRRWNYLSIGEQKALYNICLKCSPEALESKVFHHDDDLCGNALNQFYTINQVRYQVRASDSIIIVGRTRRVNNIMIYKREWMRIYYYEPML